MFAKRVDLLAGAVFLLFGLVLVFVLIPYGIDEPRRVKYAALSPSYYPFLVSVAMLCLGVAVIVRSLLVRGAQDGDDEPLRDDARIRIAAIFVILACYAVALPYGGFVLTSAAALVAMLILAGERKPLTIGLVAVLLPLLLYLFFTKLANVPIPGGVLDPVLQRI